MRGGFRALLVVSSLISMPLVGHTSEAQSFTATPSRCLYLFRPPTPPIDNVSHFMSSGLFTTQPALTNRRYSSLEEIRTLKIASYNLLDFQFQRNSALPGGFDLGGKGVKKTRELVETIGCLDADVLFLQEVISEQTAHTFAGYALSGLYRAFVGLPNPKADIRNVTMVKKSLSDHFDVRQLPIHEETWIDPMRPEVGRRNVFTREPLVLTFSRKTKGNKGKVDLVLVNVHLKSKRDRSGDPRSERLRLEQARRLAKIVESLERKTGAQVIVGGDMNGDPINDTATRLFRKLTQSVDTLDRASRPLDYPTERGTNFFTLNGNQRVIAEQIDFIWAPPMLANAVLDAAVVPYFNPNGKPFKNPTHPDHIDMGPSDHRPVVTIFDFQYILEAQKLQAVVN